MSAPSSVYKIAGHTVSLEAVELEHTVDIVHAVPEGFAMFATQRANKELIDITIIVGEKRIDAHRVLLSARIPFFKAMFCSSMVECTQPEINLSNTFCEFDADSIEHIVDYAYTGKLTIKEESVQLMMTAASFLQITAVLDECATFLSRRLKACNAVSILLFCHSIHYEKIEQKVNDFIDKNFVPISATTEFTQLSFAQVVPFLQRDTLHVDTEEQVFAAICHWIEADTTGERAKHMAALLPTVRVSRLPVKLIEETMGTNAHVLADPTAITFIDQAKGWHENTALRAELNFKTTARVCDSRNGLIFVIGSVPPEQGGDIPKDSKVEMYDPMTDAWTACNPMPSARGRCGLAMNGQTIYALGGFDAKERLSMCQYWDLAKNTWTDMGNLPEKRSANAVGVVNGIIYLCGGYDGSGSLGTVQALNANDANPNWGQVQPMSKARGAAAACVLNGKVYVIGGHDGNQIHTDGEFYDPSTNTWTKIASMKHRRCRFGVAAWKGKIWAVGGYDGAAFLKNVESYDPATNVWTSHKLMERRRSRASLVVSCGRLFAIGGFDGLNNLTSVVRYDEESDEWKEMAPLRDHSGGVSTIVVPIPAHLITPVVNF